METNMNEKKEAILKILAQHGITNAEINDEAIDPLYNALNMPTVDKVYIDDHGLQIEYKE